MLKSKKNNGSLWIVVFAVAVVTALTTVVALMLRAKCRRKRLKKSAADEACTTCMSFDCDTMSDAQDLSDEELTDDEPQE